MSEDSDLASKSAQVSNFLVKKDKFSALQLSLENPPVNSKSEELKVFYFSNTYSVSFFLYFFGFYRKRI